MSDCTTHTCGSCANARLWPKAPDYLRCQRADDLYGMFLYSRPEAVCCLTPCSWMAIALADAHPVV